MRHRWLRWRGDNNQRGIGHDGKLLLTWGSHGPAVSIRCFGVGVRERRVVVYTGGGLRGWGVLGSSFILSRRCLEDANIFRGRDTAVGGVTEII